MADFLSMIDFTSPTPLASGLSSLAFIGVLAVFYGVLLLFRRKKKARGGGGLFERVIAGLRWLDRAVVHSFSWIIGTRYRKKYIRVPLLFVFFLSLAAASVFAPWPYGMGAVAFGVFSIFVVFRHWSRDEDEAVARIPFERKDIKIDGTLGAEVLLAVAFIFVFTPIAFAQLQVQGLGFTLQQDAGPFTFLIYTLIETVKAGSLIDYYDLYADRIGFDKLGAPEDPSKWAKATIMGYRLSLNLLVLAAIKRLLDVAKRRAQGADLRAVAEALRGEDADKQALAIDKLKDFALQGGGNARDMLEQIAEPRQSEHLPIQPETRFAAADALLDYGTQRGGASALYAAADGYRALMRGGFDRDAAPKRWRAAAHNLGNTLVQLGQQIGDPERLREAARLYEQLAEVTEEEVSQASRINTLIVRANVTADLAMMTGQRADLEDAAQQYRDALSATDEAEHSTQIAMINTNLGATLADIAEIDSNDGVIREAISVYRAALEVLDAEDDRETWSMAQNNLGNALADLGFWTGEAEPLKESLKAHQAALSVRQKKDAPLLWAMSQINLANALTRLARIEQKPVRLSEAIAHYTAAQTVYQREDFPRDWAWSEASLASAHIDLANMTGVATAFEKAVSYCDGAIGGYASAKMPAKEAWVQGLKGNALVGLQKFEDAKAAFEAALDWQTFENAGDDWVMSTNNVAACWHELRQGDAAIATLRAALEAAPDEPRLLATLRALGGEPDDESAVETGGKIKVRIVNVEQHDIQEGRYLDATTLDWTLEIDGEAYRYRVTREEYIEEDGQGKGSGYRVIDLNDDNRLVYDTLWGAWMDLDRSAVFEGFGEPEEWRIGDYDGAEVFWEIDAAETELWMTSYWDVEDDSTRARLLREEGFEIDVARMASATSVDGGKPSADGSRCFMISVQRLCGEFVCGRISQDFYAYWKDKGQSDLAHHMLNMDDDEERDTASPSICPHGQDASGFYEVDDVAHMNNAVLYGNYIHVDEVRPDESDYTGYSPVADGFSEVFDIDEVTDELPETFRRLVREIEVEQDVDAPADPVVVCKSIEKGAQTVVICEDADGFDLSKLSFTYVYFDGDDVIDDVLYDGAVLENNPDSSMGRDFICYVGDLVGNEVVPQEDD